MEHRSQCEAAYTPRRITAIVPALNYAHYLPDTLGSILSQPVADLEVIVIDDCSTDDTPAVVARYADRVRYVRLPRHAGQGAATNRGVRMSTGEFLTFLDADDMWTGDKLSRQLAVLDRDPRVDMVFGGVEEFYSPELSTSERQVLALRHAPAPIAGAMMVRRSAYLRVGEFAEGLVIAEFVDWSARALEAGLQSVMLPEVVLRRRLHANNLSRRTKSTRSDYVHVLKHALDRRRARLATSVAAPAEEG